MNKPGRNDACPCGSGKKYKQCCLRAEEVASTASAAAPRIDIPALLKTALAHHQAGRLEQAEALYQQVLQREPNHADALHLLGVIAYQAGKHERAIDLICRAIASNPLYAAYHSNLGRAYQDSGGLDAAIASYERALALQPDLADAHNNLGNALQTRHELRRAIEHYRHALALKPGYAEAHNNLGRAQAALGNFDEAVVAYRAALSLNPHDADVHNNLGIALQEQGKLDAAFDQYVHTIALKPDFASAHNNLGRCLASQGRLADAIQAYQCALLHQPDHVEAHNNLGVTLQEQGLLDAAIEHYRHALTIQPDYAISHSNLGCDLANQGKLAEAFRSLRHALKLDPDLDAARSNLLFHLNNDALQSPEDYLAEARAFGERIESRATPYVHKRVAKPAARLRVGFVSGDLRAHPVGFFFESVVAHLDPERFELVAYVTKPGEDAVTARLKPYFAQWHTLLGLSDEVAARKIHEDGVDILVDLAGHTAGNRLPVFAWKPAPVQVAWLGYFASTGMSRIDYIIGDPRVLPQSEASHFVEQPWRLPDCYLCFTPPQDEIEVGGLPMLAQSHVTFGCFNKLHKMNDAVVALWSRVLEAVPGSRLLLKAKELNDASARRLTQARFAAHGIEAGRLELEGYTQRADYLANYRRVDIALDPFPYPGGTTTVEALWMGVPVLSRRGNRFLSHAGESLLSAVRLPDWIAEDERDYIAKAQVFSANPSQLAALRARLRSQMLASPLCDAPRFAAHLAAVFAGMWQDWHEQIRTDTNPGTIANTAADDDK